VLNPLPFPTSTSDSISAYDFLEHIPKFAVINNQGQFPFINFMNEVHRVLKPNGIFYAITPATLEKKLLSTLRILTLLIVKHILTLPCQA
jgi:SAM-dependent methyltransferase